MSRPKRWDEMQRKGRRVGDVLRAFVHSPLGHVYPQVKVVAYRRNSWRLECQQCGLRFSLDPETFAVAMQDLEPREVFTQHRDGRTSRKTVTASGIIERGEYAKHPASRSQPGAFPGFTSSRDDGEAGGCGGTG